MSRSFHQQLLTGLQVIYRYEDAHLQEEAVAHIPLDEIASRTQERIDASVGALSVERDFQDVQVMVLMKWFKREFFQWVDRLPCRRCGNPQTEPVASSELSRPTREETLGGATRVELYRCPLCKTISRFPRLNDPRQLLRTRRGRCGEWANCFGLVLRSLGYEVRWVRDWSDHVWCEVWSGKGARWVHADPCEEAWDKPLLYSCGWKKSLDYVLAFGRHGVVDVTRKYVPNWQETKVRRRLVNEDWLRGWCEHLTIQCLCMIMDDRERAEWTRSHAEEVRDLLRRGDANAADLQGLGGRVSGSEAWRKGRGEMQSENECELKDFVLRFSGQNPPEENAYCLFDERLSSKWLDFSFKENGTSYLELEFPVAKRLGSYELVSANDEKPRDPKSWTVEGFPGGESGEAVVLHRVRGASFGDRHERQTFVLPESEIECKRFRWHFDEVFAAEQANSIQLCMLNLSFLS
uniref:Transglutaminase-like domain-containing protein n=1 Tax=Chloropicon primus TaxID=1764295 RepID=A0A7S2WZ30_9CHLO|mmetsp:Transcript_3126/g.8604  ORF Transcript_3126/g.8604 Transcript_3126/m.8604 type:complete len:464 (+) Transcript_3126:310-1701(+)